MTDDQNRDLSKMITNTVKQYKEIFVAKNEKETEWLGIFEDEMWGKMDVSC